MALFNFEGHPGRTLHLWFFRNVTNSSDLQRRVVTGTLCPECSLINAALVADAWLVQQAAFRALTAETRNQLRTHSLHGELVYNLAGSKQISESLKRFGISPETTNLLVARFDASEEEAAAVLALVKGNSTSIAELQSCADIPLISKVYKITAAETIFGGMQGSLASRIAGHDC